MSATCSGCGVGVTANGRKVKSFSLKGQRNHRIRLLTSYGRENNRGDVPNLSGHEYEANGQDGTIHRT